VHGDTDHDMTVDEPPLLHGGVTRPARPAPARRRPPAAPASLARIFASPSRAGDVVSALLSSPPARRALRSRVLATVVAALVATTVVGRVAAADRIQEEWGERAAVAVMTRDLPAGSTVTSDDVRLVDWPTALVPPDALRRLPTRERLASAAVEGEVLVGTRLADGSSGELSAQLAPGEVAIQLPPSEVSPKVSPGDRVDVVAPAAASDLSGIGSTLQVEVVASGARVISTGDVVVSLAVRRAQAERTAGAALSGMVALVVLRGS